jgi:S1-C subfamily serine protease
VVEDADSIWIRREDESDSTKIAAELIAFNEITDLALLRVTELGGGIELSDSSLDAGKSVLALGFPLGLFGSVSVSQGIISRRIEYQGTFFVQHDAKIMQGNSGGPLLDDSGRVIGINMFVISDDVITSEGAYIAVHVGELIELMQSVGIESSIVAAIPTATPVPTPTLTPSQIEFVARHPRQRGKPFRQGCFTAGGPT